MALLTPVAPRVMDRVLIKLGFVRVRQRGSQVFYRHPDGRTTTVPLHKGRDLAVPLVRDPDLHLHLARRVPGAALLVQSPH